MSTLKKGIGFEGELFNLIPPKIYLEIQKDPLYNGLNLHSLGFFPNARYHFFRRNRGSETYIFIYCIKGTGWYTVKNEKYELRPNEILIIPKNRAHAYGSDANNPWSIYWFHFGGKLSVAIAQEFYKKAIDYKLSLNFSEARLASFYEIFKLLQSGFSRENILNANYKFAQFLSSLLFDSTELNTNDDPNDEITKSIDYLKKNINQKIELAELAKTTRFSTSHFSLLFKKRTGYAPLDYFNLLKVQKACQFLQRPNLTIKEIAYTLGYSDPYYFSRLFRQIMNVSPKTYRKNCME